MSDATEHQQHLAAQLMQLSDRLLDIDTSNRSLLVSMEARARGFDIPERGSTAIQVGPFSSRQVAIL